MTEDSEPEKPEKTGPKRKRAKAMPRWLFWLRAILVVCLLPLAFLAAAGVMIIDREITAPSWITERIEARAGDLLDGATFDFGAITLRIGRDLHPSVRLVDTRLVDQGGLILTRVPVVEGLMSPRGLILRQEVLMQEVRLIGAQVNLRRNAQGNVSFALTTGGSDLDSAQSLPELLDQFDQVFERPALEALEVVRADGMVVNFDDARAGRSWIVDGGTVALDLRNAQTSLRGNFSLLSGRAGVTNVNLSYVSPRGSRTAQIGMNLTDAVASDIAAQSPALSWLRDVDAPISASLRTELDEKGALGPLNASLDIGQGVLQPNSATRPVAFDAARAYFNYDPVRDRISFSEISLETEWGNLAAEGDAYLREFRAGLPRALLAQFQFRDVAINPPGFFDVAPQVSQAAVDLRFRFDPFAVEVGQAVIVDGDTRMIAKGEAAATDAGWRVAVDAEIDQIAPERLLDFWPLTMKPGARQWFSNNVSEGRLFDLYTGVRIAPEQEARTAFGFEFDETTIKFLRHVPPINGAKGAASIAEHQFVVSLDDGTVLAAEGGPLQLAGSHFTVLDLHKRWPSAVLDLQVDGSITASLSVLNQPPFAFLDNANLPVSLAEGRALTDGQIIWPLEPPRAMDDIAVDISSVLVGVRSATLLPDRQFIAPRLDVTATGQGVRVSGPVRVGAVSANGAWEQRFGDPERPGSRVEADVSLSQDFLDEFGIALPPAPSVAVGAERCGSIFCLRLRHNSVSALIWLG